MKYKISNIGLLLAFYLVWNTISCEKAHSQNLQIQRAVIGDTLLLVSSRAERSVCGDVQGFYSSLSDTINFFKKIIPKNGGVDYSLYFSPKDTGSFNCTFKVNWYYPQRRACSPQPGAENYSFTCDGITDSGFHILRNFTSSQLQSDTANEILFGNATIPILYRLRDTLWVDSAKAISTDTLSFYKIRLESGLMLKPKLETKYGSIPIDFITNYGPGFSGTCPFVVFFHTHNSQFVDSEFLVFSSDPLPPTQLLFSPSDEIMFYSNFYQKVDTTLTLTWSKFVDSVSISELPGCPPFCIKSVVQDGRSMRIVIKCETYRGFPDTLTYWGSYLVFNFRQRYFNNFHDWSEGGKLSTPCICVFLNSELPSNVTDVPIASTCYVSPNPYTSKSSLFVSTSIFSPADIEIYNIFSKRVLHLHKQLNIGKNEIEIDGNNLPTGIYWYVIRSEYSELTGKIVKIE